MADAGRDEVSEMVLGAWDAFLAQAEAVDVDGRSRLRGWRAHEICVHLGCWEDHTAVADLVASARDGGAGTPPDVDAVNARVTAGHLAEEPEELDTAPTVSVVGRIPLLSVLLGQAYELAVHGLDLVSCGVPPPPPEVLQSGLAALADVTGALAASMDITGRVTLATPDGGWAFASDPGGWTVHRLPGGVVEGPAVEAPAGLLLEAASGRINPVPAVARRRLKVHDVGGLLALAPIVQAVPGIPGGPILQLAAKTVGGAGGVLGRLFRRG